MLIRGCRQQSLSLWCQANRLQCRGPRNTPLINHFSVARGFGEGLPPATTTLLLAPLSAPWATQAVGWEPEQPSHYPKLMSCPRPLLPPYRIHQQFTFLALQNCAFCLTLQHESEVSFNAPSEHIDSPLFTSCPSSFGHLNIFHVFTVLQQINSVSNEEDLKEEKGIVFGKDALKTSQCCI